MELHRFFATHTSPQIGRAKYIAAVLTALVAGCSGDVESPSAGPTEMSAANVAGTPVYDANGVAIGTLDGLGNVVDVNGVVVGTVDAMGNVIDPGGAVVATVPVTTTDPVTGDVVTTDPVTGDVVTTDPVTGDVVTTDPVTGDVVTTDPVTGDVVTTDPVVAVEAATDCVPGIPGTSQIPRLTNVQYDRTIRDLLDVTSAPSGLLATEQLTLTALAWSGYVNAADTVAAEVMADDAKKANFISCEPSGDGAECLSETIQEFGRRAYRRPLTAEEVADYELLVSQRNEITEGGTFEEIAEVLLGAFLQSGSFLQRAEIEETADANGDFTLSSFEVASRLSYMLWGSMPDPELSDAADADALQTKEQVLAQAQRMIVDDKAREVVAEFHRSYLNLTIASRWDSARKDVEAFPDFVEGIVPDLIGETQTLFDEVFTTGLGFQDLLTTNIGYVSEKTAAIYGLNPDDFDEELTRVELDATERPGFLTRGAFLAAYSAVSRTSPILRGAFITKEVLGLDPGAPDPEAANTALPEGGMFDTNRKQVAEQTSPGDCAGCHAPFINPPGFVMEHFDTSGAVQLTERLTGAAIDTVADVRFSFDGSAETMNNPSELMARIATSALAQRTYAEKWVGFAYERVLAAPDVCAVDSLSVNLTAGGYSIQSLVTDLTQSDSFLTRALEVTP